MDAREVASLWESNAEDWTRLVRAGHDVYRDALNTPAFLEMLPPVDGLAGLDLGCGEGANTRALARLGARMTGVDVAPTFVRHASRKEAEERLGNRYLVADAARLPFANGAFDFATAFMSLMDMHDQPAAIREAARVLAPGGFLQFSILHPCFVPPTRRTIRGEDGTTRAIEVADYFVEADGSLEEWCCSSLSREERQATRPFRIPASTARSRAGSPFSPPPALPSRRCASRGRAPSSPPPRRSSPTPASCRSSS